VSNEKTLKPTGNKSKLTGGAIKMQYLLGLILIYRIDPYPMLYCSDSKNPPF